MDPDMIPQHLQADLEAMEQECLRLNHAVVANGHLAEVALQERNEALAVIDLMTAALNACGERWDTCRPCSVCGDDHHWIDTTLEDWLAFCQRSANHPLVILGEEYFYVCKHCEAWRLTIDEEE